MITVNMLQLGAMPSGYGIEPKEGRRCIPALVNFGTDANWFFDFTLLQMQKIFSYPQTIVIDSALNTGAGFDVFVNGSQKVFSVASIALATGFPFICPIFAKDPANVLISGRGGAAGTLVANFLNFPLLAGQKGFVL